MTARPNRPASALVVLAAGLLCVAGCASGDRAGDGAPGAAGSPPAGDAGSSRSPEDPPDSTVVSGKGTVQYVDLEGGFYGIVDDEDGERYQLDTLAAPYRTDGLEVRYRLLVRPGRVSFRMWGTPAEVLALERIEQDDR